jgi:hypothetical protein
MKIGVQFQPIQVKGNFIVNGHHRYIASKLADIEMECIPWEAPEIMMTYQWKEIWLDPLDWDTPEEIKAYHQKDAQEYKFDKSILDFFETNIP